MSVEKSEKRSKKNIRSWKIYIHKVLKLVHPDARLTNLAIDQLDQYIKVLASTLAESARLSTISVGKKTVGSLEIDLATKLLLPGELAMHGVSELTKAIVNFNSGQEERAPKRREERAKLQFSVSFAEKYIREFGASDLNMGAGAPIALAAVLEYITAEILELAGNIARDNRKVTIVTRDIYIAIRSDSELFSLMEILKIDFFERGELPGIRDELLPVKGKKSKKSKNVSDEKKAHRFRPGTRALMEIRKEQKKTDTTLQKLPFDRAVREIVGNENSVKYGGNVIHTLQVFVEQKTTELLRSAQDFAIHAKRDGVNGADVSLAWMKTDKIFPHTDEKLENISNNGIERLARRGGVKRKTSDMYDVTRSYMYSLTRLVISQCLHIISYRKVHTISLRDLRHAFKSLGLNFLVPSKKKTKK